VDPSASVPEHLREHLARLYPERTITSIQPMAPDSGATQGSTSKAAGFSLPVYIRLDGADGPLELVWRVAGDNELGHDRRSDRAASLIQAFDDFSGIPRHIQPIDVGAITPGGELISMRDGGELYLITEFAPGTLYATDLRRIANEAVAREVDLRRVAILARYLAELHTPVVAPHRYRRVIRDLVGSGEGIYGIVDAYPSDVPGASRERLHAIERRCADWRWRLREHESRLARTHGDFHPFNIVFRDDDQLALLDASRGGCGDPADDVTALAVNFVLFALDAPGAWARGLGPLWHRFWEVYLRDRPDPVLTSVSPPFFAWRALVVCNPKFYPQLGRAGRDSLLGLAEAALDAHHLEPAWADELFR